MVFSHELYEDLEELDDCECLEELEDEQVRNSLRGRLGNVSPSIKAASNISAKALQESLSRAHRAVRVEHEAATEIWRGPLSLFDSRKTFGLESWAAEAVLTAQRLAREAARLGDRTEVYDAQIKLAEVQGLGVHKALLLEHFERLDDLATRLHSHLFPLRLARETMDAWESSSLGSVVAASVATSAKEAARENRPPSLYHASDDVSAGAPGAAMFNYDEDEDDRTHLIIISEPPQQHHSAANLIQTHVKRGWRSVKKGSKASVLRVLQSASEFNIDALLGGIAASALPQHRSYDTDTLEPTLGKPSWEDVRGVPSTALDLANPTVEKQTADVREAQIRPIIGDGAHSRWDRSRRRTTRAMTLP